MSKLTNKVPQHRFHMNIPKPVYDKLTKLARSKGLENATYVRTLIIEAIQNNQ